MTLTEKKPLLLPNTSILLISQPVLPYDPQAMTIHNRCSVHSVTAARYSL